MWCILSLFVQCDEATALDSFFNHFQSISEPTFFSTICCGCSTATTHVAEISHHWHIPQVRCVRACVCVCFLGVKVGFGQHWTKTIHGHAWEGDIGIHHHRCRNHFNFRRGWTLVSVVLIPVTTMQDQKFGGYSPLSLPWFHAYDHVHVNHYAFMCHPRVHLENFTRGQPLPPVPFQWSPAIIVNITQFLWEGEVSKGGQMAPAQMKPCILNAKSSQNWWCKKEQHVFL